MGERPTVLVIGAGIGGLTAALAVARAGFDIVICERAAELSELGAGIQVSPNAGRVLAELGLDDTVTFAPAMPARDAFAHARAVVVPSPASPPVVSSALPASPLPVLPSYEPARR